MDRATFNTFCSSLRATTHVVQWGNADAWNVGGKVFVFKAFDIVFDVLKDQPGIRPAPYITSRGLKWLHHCDLPGLSDEYLRHHIARSYQMVTI